MPGFSFSEEDINSTNKLEPRWYPFDVKKVFTTVGKTDPNGTTYNIDLVERTTKTPIRHYFSDKAPNMMINYIKAFTKEGKMQPGVEYPLEDTAGNSVQGYVQWDAQFNKNKITDWKHINAK